MVTKPEQAPELPSEPTTAWALETLGDWRRMVKTLRTAPENHLWVLLSVERKTENRPLWTKRIYGKYAQVRRHRELQEFVR